LSLGFALYTAESFSKQQASSVISSRSAPVQRSNRLLNGDDVCGQLGQDALLDRRVDARHVGRRLDRVVGDDVDVVVEVEEAVCGAEDHA